ncbi:hypothetical protein FF1_045976 [Malus domestica]
MQGRKPPGPQPAMAQLGFLTRPAACIDPPSPRSRLELLLLVQTPNPTPSRCRHPSITVLHGLSPCLAYSDDLQIVHGVLWSEIF